MSTPEDTPPAENLAETKAAIRAAARIARCAIDATSCAREANALARQLLGLPELAGARLVLVYSAIPEEISVAPMTDALREGGASIAYPRIEERGTLAIHIVEHDADLVTGPMGILEPAASAPRPEPDSVDVVLVPGVAFDERGGRVGFGGGFYDRLLPMIPRAVRVGVAYEEQLAEAIPREPHDVAMDIVATPDRVIRIGRAP